MEKKKVLPSIVDAWEKRQEGLSKDELSAKETQNRAVDQRRNADLEKLKAMGAQTIRFKSDGKKIRIF